MWMSWQLVTLCHNKVKPDLEYDIPVNLCDLSYRRKASVTNPFAKILREIGKTGTIKTGMYFSECLTGIWVDYLAAN